MPAKQEKISKPSPSLQHIAVFQKKDTIKETNINAKEEKNALPFKSQERRLIVNDYPQNASTPLSMTRDRQLTNKAFKGIFLRKSK